MYVVITVFPRISDLPLLISYYSRDAVSARSAVESSLWVVRRRGTPCRMNCER